MPLAHARARRDGGGAVSAVTGTWTIALSASTVAALALYGAVPTAAEVRAALARRRAATTCAPARGRCGR